MLLRSWRIIFVLSLYILTLLCYLGPVFISNWWMSGQMMKLDPNHLASRIISLCNCVAAGIFLAMCFLGLIPNVRDDFRQILHEFHWNWHVSVGDCVVIIGFFFTLTLEQLLACWKERKLSNSNDEKDEVQTLLDEKEMDNYGDTELSTISAIEYSDKPRNGDMRLELVPEDTKNYGTRTEVVVTPGGHSHLPVLLEENGGMRFFLLLLAISMHSVFEGIALGLQNDISRALHLFVAVVIHECLVAVALGVNSASVQLSTRKNVKFAIAFAATIPLGVLLGVSIGHTPGLTGRAVSAFFQGFAAGIFLHVVFQDFLPVELSNKKDRMFKVLFFFLGFVILTGVIVLINDR